MRALLGILELSHNRPATIFSNSYLMVNFVQPRVAGTLGFMTKFQHSSWSITHVVFFAFDVVVCCALFSVYRMLCSNTVHGARGWRRHRGTGENKSFGRGHYEAVSAAGDNRPYPRAEGPHHPRRRGKTAVLIGEDDSHRSGRYSEAGLEVQGGARTAPVPNASPDPAASLLYLVWWN